MQTSGGLVRKIASCPRVAQALSKGKNRSSYLQTIVVRKTIGWGAVTCLEEEGVTEILFLFLFCSLEEAV
jgi:hypothetical protein